MPKSTGIFLLLIFLASLKCSDFSPVILKSSSSTKEKEEAQKQNSKILKTSSDKGGSNLEAESGYKKDNEHNHSSAEDKGHYGEDSSSLKDHQNSHGSAMDRHHSQQGEEESDSGREKGHHRGHHRSGFHNTYSKEESGSNNSYYDDSEDAGHMKERTNQKGLYGDSKIETARGNEVDNSHIAKEQSKHGAYDQGGAYEGNRGDQKNYNRNAYNDNKHTIAEEEGGGGGSWAAAERYADREIGHPYVYQPPPRRTITIYEDPRVYGHGGYPPISPVVEGDQVRLEIRPPPHAGYSNGEDYDYY